MTKPIAAVTILTALTISGAASAEPIAMIDSREMKWVDTAAPNGAKEAFLWGDAKSPDQGTMVRWKFNSKLRDQVRTQDSHFVVLTGTFTVEIDGKYREFGPGSFVGIPRGTKHTIGCEASGECKFVVHRIVPAESGQGTPGK